MNELNKKLAEKLVKWRWPDAIYEVHQTYVDVFIGKDEGTVIVNFTDDLNDCFEWLVPKAIDKSSDVLICFSLVTLEGHTGWSCELEISRYQGENRAEIVEGMGDTPALALCKAIEQLIDNEGNKTNTE